MAVSWRDALRQAAAAPVRPAPIDPGAVSPTLQRLLDERKRMESKLSELTGVDPTGQGGRHDPRFAVAPLAQRRAELARWAAARDASRPASASRQPEPERAARMPGEPDPMPADRSAAGRGPAERVFADRTLDRSWSERGAMDRMLPDRSVAGRMLAAFAVPDAPALRATPGETVGSPAPPANAFNALRDALRDQAPGRGDASGLTERAFDRIATRVARPLKGEDAIARAKTAISDDWRARARKMVPTLENTAYAKRAKKLLGVDVGSLEDLADKAEKLRDTLRDARELKAADDAGDDRRRDRALERLKAKRQEGARDAG